MKKIISSPITGKEKTAELFEKSFNAFVGRELRTAYKIIRQMIIEDHTIVLAFSGALTPADLGTSCLIPFLQAGFADILTTTGANLYHDIQRLESDDWFEVDPNFGDIRLKKKKLARVYDVVFPDRDLRETDKFIRHLLLKKEFNQPMTTSQFHFLLGKYLVKEGRKCFKNFDQKHSILIQAYKLDIPVFCGAPQDSSIFLNFAFLKRKFPKNYKFVLDLETDIHEFAAYHYFVKHRWSKKLSIIILGGGVPKNYSLQGEPYLSQIWGLNVGGYDSDVQICDAHIQNGSLSSCTASEGYTWGKTSKGCLKKSQYVFSDITSTFPFIVHGLLQEKLNKKPHRLLKFREEAFSFLDKTLKI